MRAPHSRAAQHSRRDFDRFAFAYEGSWPRGRGPTVLLEGSLPRERGPLVFCKGRRPPARGSVVSLRGTAAARTRIPRSERGELRAAKAGARVSQASSAFDEPIAAGAGKPPIARRIGRARRPSVKRIRRTDCGGRPGHANSKKDNVSRGAEAAGTRIPRSARGELRAAKAGARASAKRQACSTNRLRRAVARANRAQRHRARASAKRQAYSTNRGRRALGMRTLREDRVGVGAERRERDGDKETLNERMML